VSTAQRWSAVKLVAFLIGCFLIASYFFSLAGTHILPGDKPYKVQAVVPTAVSLAKAGDVRAAGVNIGRVTKIADRGNATIMQLDIDKEHSPVYRDATVLVRAKSVAGENYVEINPGTPKAGPLPSGAVLSIDHAEEATQIDQLFSVFNQARRRDLQRALGGLADGLDDGGADLNKTVEGLSSLANEGGGAVDTLATNSSKVAGLVDSFGRVTRALGDRREALQTFTRQVKVAAEAAGSRDRQLRELIATLPGFLHQARNTSNHLQSFSGVATPVVRDLRLASQDLVPTVRDLLPAARDGQKVAGELRTFARRATPAVTALKPFAASGSRFVPPLGGFLRQANPFFEYIAPYNREIANFFALDAASFETTDALGHIARVTLPVSRSDLPGILTADEEKFLQELSGPLDTRGTNAYPKPGGSAKGVAPSGSYPRLEAEPPYTPTGES
jgi:phospholipid/cholesterol/gamma-HCH transport system substrate-binding protein